MNHLDLFTDGGAVMIHKEFYGSSAYVIKYKERYITSCDPVKKGTNNYYELKGIRDGLRTIVNGWNLDDLDLWIISDSQYAISCVTIWFDGWEKVNGVYRKKRTGEVVANIDLILEIRELLLRIPHYRFIKIKSHIDNNIERSYRDFLTNNNLTEDDVPYVDYLILVRFNETCDNKITKAFNKKRRDIADKIGVELVGRK